MAKSNQVHVIIIKVCACCYLFKNLIIDTLPRQPKCFTQQPNLNFKTKIGHVNDFPTMHYFGSFFIYVFDWVFLEIPEKICIMGIFFSCPIGIKSLICTIRIEVINISQQKLWHSTTTVWDGHISSQNACVVSKPTDRHCCQQGIIVLLLADSREFE